MNWKRINAILLHSWYHASHSMETWIDLVWFSFFGALVFGFMMLFFSHNDPIIAQNILLGMFFWEIIRIGQYSVSVSIMWEIWSKSFSSLFISPLTMTEMMVAQMIAATIKTIAVGMMLFLVSIIFFHFSILQLGWMLILYVTILLFFSFAAGFFITGLIFRFGTDIQSLSWALIFMLQPLSAVYYPLEVLPQPIRWLAYGSPITYVMEAVRSQVFYQLIDWPMIGVGAVLTLGYFASACWFMHFTHHRSRQTGSFARLGN